MKQMKYTLLGRSGMRVSELCLGTMTFGEDWGWGASRDESRRIFEAFCRVGGNFIDTACNYTGGTSEKFVGEFVANERDRYVVATKYTLTMDPDDPNAGGNSRKNLMHTVEGSLNRMNTDYIDLLYVHMWDFTTPIESVMRALDDVVRQGKVRAIGISDTPAWIAAQGNVYASLRGWTPAVALQLPYSLLERSPERDLLPFAKDSGMSVLAWGALEGGALTGKYSSESSEPRRNDSVSDRARDAGDAVLAVAKDLGVSASAVAYAWVAAQQMKAHVIPILGARTAAQLEQSLQCLEVSFTDEIMQRMDAIAGFSPGFPHDFLSEQFVLGLIHGKHNPLQNT